MIYIAAHKEFKTLELKDYCPLQVGAEMGIDLGYAKDNTGENISAKNPNFCELTGLYWIWKNCEDEYKGIVHYRRYFGKNSWSRNTENIYTYSELVGFLNQNVDIVLPNNEYFLQNAKEELLVSCCTKEIFDKLRESIIKVSPQYISAFDLFFAQNKCSLFNMMFCRKEVFDSYCEWLFSILFELEKNVDLDKLTEYQKRLYGFLAERLLNVWVGYNKLKIKNLPVINMEMSLCEKITMLRRRTTNRIRYRLQCL